MGVPHPFVAVSRWALLPHPGGVTLISPGSRSALWGNGAIGDSKYPEGVAQASSSRFVQPLRGRPTLLPLVYPGCAARPWAVECDPFGVRQEQQSRQSKMACNPRYSGTATISAASS